MLDICPIMQLTVFINMTFIHDIQVKEIVLIPIFLVIVIASGADLVADLSHGAGTEHILKESLVLLISIAGIAWLILGLRQQRQKIDQLRQELQVASKNCQVPESYVIEGRKNLGQVVSQQFSEWQLTNSENEVGWLLLKGFSLKEIAALRDTREKTVRQQASAIYRKAGVNGRHTFSAWFIEDIL